MANTPGSVPWAMFLLLQQLQQQNAFGPGPNLPEAKGPSVWKPFAAEAAEAAKT